MKKADSLLWTTPAGKTDPFGHLEIPDDLNERVAEILNDPEHKRQIEERVKAYRTRPNWKIMLKPIY